MSGWVPFQADGWPEVVELLQASGMPWPEAAVIFDLRWHVDQQVVLPGRGDLKKRWGWKVEEHVKKLLAEPGLWWDPKKGKAPESRKELERYCPVKKRVPRKKAAPPPEVEVPAAEEETPSAEEEISPGGSRSLQVAPGGSRWETVEPEESAENHQVAPGGSRSPQVTSIARSLLHTTHSPSQRESTRAHEGSVADAPDGGPPSQRERSEPAGRGWASEPQWGLPADQVVDLVCRISGAIRERPVRPVEAATDSGHVSAVLALDPDRPLPVLAEQAALVARWAREAPEGRDDLGGLRPSGERWGMDRSRRVGSVLDPRKWPDRLDAARRWFAGGGRAAPPSQARGHHPGRNRELTPEERIQALAALEELRNDPTLTILETT